MKKIVAAAIAGVAVLGAVGCTANVSQRATDDGLYVENSYGGGSVSVIEVPDGDRTVKCAVLIGYSKGGISCDWAAVQ